jgi:hypothetical protein
MKMDLKKINWHENVLPLSIIGVLLEYNYLKLVFYFYLVFDMNN